MLHEILLSLSGNPSPLLRTDNPSDAFPLVSPSERELLASVAHLSDLHIKLQSHVAQIVSVGHASTICRATATAIKSVHLTAFRRKVREVEEGILRRDPDLVGAYNIVPLTAVVSEFSGWTRRMEWLWGIVQFILTGNKGNGCRGAQLIDRLRTELQTGYLDIEQTALSLISAAEAAWLKQVSAWILYGRLPSFGGEDFFIQKAKDAVEGYVIEPTLLPTFVSESAASSMLFIGRSLNYVREKSSTESGLQGLDNLSPHLKELSALTYPLEPASLSRAITTIRIGLSRSTLQKLLPLSRVIDTLRFLRDFFLLGRGEFAMALTQQADAKLRSRWKRADNLAYEKREGLGAFAVKEGEVMAVLAKTWASMGLMQGQHADEDQDLELARELLHLQLTKSKPDAPLSLGYGPSQQIPRTLATTPFRNLLFSVPVVLTMEIPSPLDMFLSPSDLQTYSIANPYLLSIRRAHIHLTDLWKITSLRKHHPAPPGPPAGSTRSGKAKVRLLRDRFRVRSNVMRSTWVTANAALFFLAETESYLQTEVVAVLWDGFHAWMTAHEERVRPRPPSSEAVPKVTTTAPLEGTCDNGTEDVWLAQSTSALRISARSRGEHPAVPTPACRRHHDPQSLATAHACYLAVLSHRLLLTSTPWTDSLFGLLVNIDHLVALVQRLQGIWTSMDLEADAGVVDAFIDLENEEADVKAALQEVERKVKGGVEEAIAALRTMEADTGFADDIDRVSRNVASADPGEDGVYDAQGQYIPERAGGVERLLMKLEFGGWFTGSGAEAIGLGNETY
ncbi:Spc97/Spc98 family protein [Sodiomyces alkalinus F11]|uniref:Spindle pole body component n=1 Tax=Sodiomyces alkalinus (strain CBS 110278 / VKM F-3762 / F11) TaxID=1314773 RepID=A0A3N2Q4U5_SODAK|nr:Spc97/Spc98 family protein [Sodiomyces alkalinus F11]ROT41794.1 Spc97/Spc98 family protein [Sodiomyces alkalinus F11]